MQRSRLGTLVKGFTAKRRPSAALDKGAKARKTASMRNDARTGRPVRSMAAALHGVDYEAAPRGIDLVGWRPRRQRAPYGGESVLDGNCLNGRARAFWRAFGRPLGPGRLRQAILHETPLRQWPRPELVAEVRAEASRHYSRGLALGIPQMSLPSTRWTSGPKVASSRNSRSYGGRLVYRAASATMRLRSSRLSRRTARFRSSVR